MYKWNKNWINQFGNIFAKKFRTLLSSEVIHLHNRKQEKIDDVLRCHLQRFNFEEKKFSRYGPNQLSVTHVRLFTNKTCSTVVHHNSMASAVKVDVVVKQPLINFIFTPDIYSSLERENYVLYTVNEQKKIAAFLALYVHW